jgi:hypothetical protein
MLAVILAVNRLRKPGTVVSLGSGLTPPRAQGSVTDLRVAIPSQEACDERGSSICPVGFDGSIVHGSIQLVRHRVRD